MLKAHRDARDLAQAAVAQDRELHFHHGSSMDAVNRRNDEGATSLHLAILCHSASKVRQLLASGARLDLEVRPAQPKSTFVAMASLASRLNVFDTESERNKTIIDAIKQPLDIATSNSCRRVLIEHAGENALTLAISYEAPFEIIEMLVKHCALHCPELLRQTDAKGNPPLLLAATSKRCDAVDVARLLLESSVALAVDQTNGLQRTALMEAVRRGDTSMVELLLQAGASCDIVDNHGYNATAHAVLCEWPALHHLMIEFQRKGATGPQAQKLDEQCLRDFSFAASRGQRNVLRQMLADQKQRLCGGKATLTVDQQYKFADFIQAGLFVAIHVPNNGAVIRCLTNDGAANADLPDVHGVRQWQKAKDKEALEALLEKVFKTDTTNIVRASSQAILAEAARHGSIDYACLALDAGAGIETPDPVSRRNALMTAVARNDRPLIVALLKRGASMLGNALPVPGNALAATLADCALATARDAKPLALACELVVFIVENCPDRYVQPHHAGLLLDLAVAMKLPGLVTLFLKDGKLEPRWFQHRPRSLLTETVDAGSTEFAAALLQSQAPLLQLLNADNGNADEALALASAGAKRDIFRLVLQSCNIDQATDRVTLARRLMLAVAVGCVDSCKLILTQGGLQLPPTAPAAENPLILAVKSSYYEVIVLMLQHGAHACARHERKASALSRALAAGDMAALELLLGHDRYPEELGAVLPKLLKKSTHKDNCRAFEILLEKFIHQRPDAKGLVGMLQQAVTLGSMAAITKLLKNGADPAPTAAEGQALLELAMLSPHPDLDIVRLLFSNERFREVLYRDAPDDQLDIDPYCGLDFKKMAGALVTSNASGAQAIEWMALTFCSIRKTLFSSIDTMNISCLRTLFKPLLRQTGQASVNAMLACALRRGYVLARSLPDPEATLEQLEFAERVLDLSL
jgi:ankyrin repeat protein